MNVNEVIEYLYHLAFDIKKLMLKNDNWQKLTKDLFDSISNDREPICRLSDKISKLKEDYNNISEPYVRGETFGGIGGGIPIGSSTSYDERIHYVRGEILKEISDLAVKKRLKEEQLRREIEAFEYICSKLSNPAYESALLKFYIDKKDEKSIGKEMHYTTGTIKNYIYQGSKEVSNMLKNYQKTLSTNQN